MTAQNPLPPEMLITRRVSIAYVFKGSDENPCLLVSFQFDLKLTLNGIKGFLSYLIIKFQVTRNLFVNLPFGKEVSYQTI